jgi:hypothetical protein
LSSLTTTLTSLAEQAVLSLKDTRVGVAVLALRTPVRLFAVFLAALLLGTASASYMTEQGTPLTTSRVGPWSSWVSEGNPTADRYTKAHLARSGRLSLTSTTARYFTARTDSRGRTLWSDCDYSITGFPINARWWSLALYDEQGSVIQNPSERYSFNSEEAIRRGDGSFHITMASQARPENWLPSGTGWDKRLILLLRVYGPRESDSDGIGQIPDERLPQIDRIQCN